MIRKTLLLVALVAIGLVSLADDASAFHPRRHHAHHGNCVECQGDAGNGNGAGYGGTWHGGYYHYMYGQPLALVVPPTASRMTTYRWGVTGTTVDTIYPQYGRSYPGEVGGNGGHLSPTPYFPSSTNQFGVYPVRGPW